MKFFKTISELYQISVQNSADSYKISAIMNSKTTKINCQCIVLCFIRSKSNGVQKMAKIISGLAIAKEIRHELKEHIIEWEQEGHRPPHLTAVLIGDDPASHTYVNNKIKVRN